MCRDGIPPKNCAAVIILALSSSVLTSAQSFEGLDHYPRVSKQKKVEFDRLVLSPPALPSVGVGIVIAWAVRHGLEDTWFCGSDLGGALPPVRGSSCPSWAIPSFKNI